MNELIKVNPEEYGIEKSRAQEMTAGLAPCIEERKLLIQEFENIKDLEINEENTKIFKELRQKFVKNRTQGINEWHKKAKDIPLRLGQLIDAVKRAEVHINEEHERILLQSEKHFENLEKERIAKLQSVRSEALLPYFEEAESLDLGNMHSDVWESFFETKKRKYNERIEAEEKAEAERIAREKAEAEEQERVKQENEKLKKEAAAREKAEAAAEEKRKAEAAALEAKLKKEVQAREKAEAEVKAKAQAEADAKKKEAEEQEAALKMGDSQKFAAMITDLEILKNKYSFKSKENKKKAEDVKVLITKIITHITK